MPAVHPQSLTNHVTQQIQTLFQDPYCHWTAKEILDYFQARTSVTYFPVVDPVETGSDKIENILKNRFEFNGETHHLPSPVRWTHNPSPDLEWLILLHKFYYAVGLGIAFDKTHDLRYAEKWMELKESWITQVPLNFLSSDVAGRRIQNWIFAHYYFVTEQTLSAITPEFYIKFLSSLSQQVGYLCRHLTPARNHRTLELCAIFLAGVVFPELRQAAHWLKFGQEQLVTNMETDILPDGVHCELSTDYHHLVLKNYLWVRRLAALNHLTFPAMADELMIKALDFALYAHKPDGMIPSLSDGDSRCFLNLLEQGYQLYGKEPYRYIASKGREGTPPQERSKGFPHGGYYILRSGWGNKGEPFEDERYLIFDCGPLGAGNHGHLDLLNFEMAAYGQSLIVDPGRYTYDESGEINWRVRFRETAAHNTVLIDGKNQTRFVFSRTRYKIQGPPPEYELKRFVTQPDCDFLHGIARSHEYPVIHERKIFFVCPEYWIMTDRLTANTSHKYDLRFHLSSLAHKNVFMQFKNNTLTVHSPHFIMAQPVHDEILPLIEEGSLSPRYGVRLPAPIIRFSQWGACALFHTVLVPYKTIAPVISIETGEVRAGNGALPVKDASLLYVTITRHNQTLYDTYFLRHTESDEACRFDQITCRDHVLFFRKNEQGHIIRKHAF